MAKPLTRLLRKFCNLMGYDLLRLQKTRIHPEALGGQGRGGGFDAFEAVVPREVRRFDILFRSCARIEVQGQSRLRFVGAPKNEVALRCLNSLVQSIAYARSQGLETDIRLTVLDDHSDTGYLAAVDALIARAPCPARVVGIAETGGGPACGAALDFARRECPDLIYFVEDDYLHDERAALEITQSFARLSAIYKRDVALFPSDYPDRYRRVDSTHVLLGSHRHWRAVKSSTFTMVTTRGLLERYWDFYSGIRLYGVDPAVAEHNTIDRVYEDVPCLSPLPSLAVHLQHFETLSPYFDWQKWWEKSKI